MFRVKALSKRISILQTVRVCLFIPQVEDMLNEVKFSKYVDTGKYVIDIDLADLLKLYINHRPAFGISAYELQHAFEVLGLQNKNCGNALNRGELLQLLQSTGKPGTSQIKDIKKSP